MNHHHQHVELDDRPECMWVEARSYAHDWCEELDGRSWLELTTMKMKEWAVEAYHHWLIDRLEWWREVTGCVSWFFQMEVVRVKIGEVCFIHLFNYSSSCCFLSCCAMHVVNSKIELMSDGGSIGMRYMNIMYVSQANVIYYIILCSIKFLVHELINSNDRSKAH